MPPADSGCSTRVVINEVQVFAGSTPGWEYIELHNAGTCAASLDGWSLIAQLSALTPEVFRFGATHVIAPGGYLLLAENSTPDLPAGTPRWASGGFGFLGDAVGGVRLLDRSNTPIDRVGWTESAMASPSMEFFEGGPKQFPGARTILALSRSPNGRDTNNNAMDFVFNIAPSPGAANP